VKETRSRQWEK